MWQRPRIWRQKRENEQALSVTLRKFFYEPLFNIIEHITHNGGIKNEKNTAPYHAICSNLNLRLLQLKPSGGNPAQAEAEEWDPDGAQIFREST